MKASVIIRAYNAETTIGRALKSALAQDFPREEYEIIVVDDGSTDGTAALVEQYLSDPRVRLVRQANAGAIAAGNAGFLAAAGEYLSLLDDDDMFEPMFLTELSARLDDDPALDYVYADYYEEFEGTRRAVHLDDLFQTIVDNGMYRTRSLLAADGWTPDVFFAEYDLLLRTLGDWKSAHIPKPLSTYCRRKESLTGEKTRVSKAFEQLLRLHPDKKEEIARIRSYELPC